MPQIFIMSRKGEIIEKIAELNAGNSNELIRLAEEVWPMAKDDITLTAVRTSLSVNEADLQVEVRYTTDWDYGNGEGRFDPDAKDREALADAIGKKLKGLFPFLEDISVWVMPYRDTTFKIFR